MKLLYAIILGIPGIFLSVNQAVLSPKITQAALIIFKVNEVTALAVEEFGKPLRLVMLGSKELVYSTQFGNESDVSVVDTEFYYTKSFLRFKCFIIKGLPSPLLFAVATYPGGSDNGYEIKLITEIDSSITSINPAPIRLTIQDGIFLGYINRMYGYGMITWYHHWDTPHYSPHKYEIRIFKWDQRSKRFVLSKTYKTQNKFKNGNSALLHYGLPCKNLRDEVVQPNVDISTLGIEKAIQIPESKNH